MRDEALKFLTHNKIPNNASTKSLSQEGFFSPPGLVLCQEETGPE